MSSSIVPLGNPAVPEVTSCDKSKYVDNVPPKALFGEYVIGELLVRVLLPAVIALNPPADEDNGATYNCPALLEVNVIV